MLKKLLIKDFAIVEQLEIEFAAGFQVLTGETGAGKSILVGAIGLLCGERGQSDLVRTGAEKAILEAEFETDPNRYKHQLLQELGIELIGHYLIIRREINQRGISRAFINDSPVNVNTLSMITSDLIDLHGQHQHQKLIHPENHLAYLDAYGQIKPLLEVYQSSYHAFINKQNIYQDLIKQRKSSYEKHDLYTFQVKELDKANIGENELSDLEGERKILENNELLFELANQVAHLLYTSDDSAAAQISKTTAKLKSLAEIDPLFAEQIKNIETALVAVEEIGRFCENYHANLEFNPQRLEEIRNRQAELEWLMKKYQVKGLSELITRREQMRRQLDEIENFDEKIEKIEEQLAELRSKLKKYALDLSESRKETAIKFERELVPILESVGLKNIQFQVKIRQQEREDGVIELEGKKYQITETGIDQVEFNVGINVGESIRPLHKIASGGEVSRIMLGIKSLLADADQIDTLIFDEIDSGISGRYAEIVGKKMTEIARHHQLIVITHLPQIAAFGQAHFAVSKDEKDQRTVVFVRRLDSEDRVLELSKLLGGAETTPQAIANARDMIRKGQSIHIDSK